jgi:cytochrome P450
MNIDYDSVDYFADPSIVADPYPYYEWLRGRCPVYQDPKHGVMITGYQEALKVMADNNSYSRVNTVGGPVPGLPVEPEGDDIGDLIEQYRHIFPLGDQVVTLDPPDHERHRHLLTRLLTPRRLQDNEEFFWQLADREIDIFHARGRCEFVHGYAEPYATLTITNILGVPEADHAKFRAAFETPVIGRIDGSRYSGGHVTHLEEWFTQYIEDRRRRPRDDTLTKIALAKFPDGSTPELKDVVGLASFLFAGGRGTTVHLLAGSLQVLAEDPELQQLLREDRSRIPNFIEEMLRLESAIKTLYRLTRKTTELDGVNIKAGTMVTMLLGACNRDPRHFEQPQELDIDRPNAMTHIAFGRGIGTCPGGSLARAEARVTLNRVLDRMGDIRVSEEHHGPPDNRRYGYDPTYTLRRLSELHLEFTPVRQ